MTAISWCAFGRSPSFRATAASRSATFCTGEYPHAPDCEARGGAAGSSAATWAASRRAIMATSIRNERTVSLEPAEANSSLCTVSHQAQPVDVGPRVPPALDAGEALPGIEGLRTVIGRLHLQRQRPV